MVEIFSVKNTVNPAGIKKTSLAPLHFTGNTTRSDIVSFQATWM
ncbi:MAG: hypothetical protein AB1782_03245 [Cyanobacteriota bacterium]